MDILELYVAEAKKYPLLTAEEEQSLAECLLKGNPEEAKIARSKFVNSNLRLVIALAYKYSYLMDIEDLIQEGNIGLMRAVEQYNPNRARFSTYATWWIRQTMIRAAYATGSNLRLPNFVHVELEKLQQIQRHLCKVLKREPTLEEIADFAETSVCRVQGLLCYLPQVDLLLDTIQPDDGYYVDNVSDMGDSVDGIALRDDLKEQCRDLVGLLPERAQKILYLRYGDDPKSFVEIAKIIRVSSARVRQIHNRDLKYLRRRAKRLERDMQ